MQKMVRRPMGLLADGLPEARYETVISLLRSCICVTSALLILLTGSTRERLVLPAALNVVIAAGSTVLAVVLVRRRSVDEARLWGRWSTAADVAIYAALSAAFASHPGTAGFYGAFVLLEGPIRYGLRGILATGVPIGLIATIWPQVDALGNTVPANQIVLLCLIFCLPAIVVRTLVMRGGARLRQAEQQFATAFDHASIGMALTDRDLHVLQANRSLGTLVGETPAVLIGTRLDAAVDLPDRPRMQAALRNLSDDHPSTRLEVRLRRTDGGLRWGHVSASLLAGGAGVAPRVVVQIENITERKRSEDRLSHAAGHDGLTDLPNRSLLLTRLDAALQRGEDVGVLFIDLDRFKVVNDGLGHAGGDLLLVEVATRLRAAMRPEDMVARLGGDEFVVLCASADVATAKSVAIRVIDLLHSPIPTAGGGELVIGASIGIALAGPGDSAELVLRDADTAMYAAKSAGGGRLHMFSPALRDAVVRSHQLEVDLRAALRADQLTLVYQPVFDVTEGWVSACEALARWQHPRHGNVSPTEFVGVAEQSDLILELGEWVLHRALADLVSWPVPFGGPEPVVAVNVSLRELVSHGFATKVQTALRAVGAEPSRLCLEVTETVLAGDVEPVIEALSALRAVGVRLSIDDFGTGHASLTYLARFPVDQVKVDRSFVAGLSMSAGSAAIVGGVIAMARTFDLRVVAEGVETAAQLAALRELGCDEVQGYLMARPMPHRALVNFLTKGPANNPVPRPRDEPKVGEAPVGQDELAETRRLRLL